MKDIINYDLFCCLHGNVLANILQLGSVVDVLILLRTATCFIYSGYDHFYRLVSQKRLRIAVCCLAISVAIVILRGGISC